MSCRYMKKLNNMSGKILAILLTMTITILSVVACGDEDIPYEAGKETSLGYIEPSGDDTTDEITQNSSVVGQTTSEHTLNSSSMSGEVSSSDRVSSSEEETTSTEQPDESTTNPTTTPSETTTTRPPATTTTTSPPTTTTRPPVTTTNPPTTERETDPPPKVNYNVKIDEPVASGTAVSDMNGYIIDYSNMQDGYVMVKAQTSATAVVQVYLDSKSGTLIGQYFIDAKDTYLAFPLTKGANTYCVRVLEKKSSGGYVQKNAITGYAAISPETKAYIHPNMYVDFNIKSTAVRLSCELCAGKKTNEEKVKAIYDYIVKNIDYDTEFAKKVAENGMVGYMDAERCLKNKKGICGDYSVLFATMCRAQGIPCMVVEGYVTSGGQIFHAWNKVYLGGSWKFYDTTFDAGGGKGKNYIEVYFY